MTRRFHGVWLAIGGLLAGAALLPAQDKPNSEPAPLAGCEAQVKSGGKKGKQERFYAMPPAKVKSAAIAALNALEFEVKKDKGADLEAKKARHVGLFVGSGGETVKLQIKEGEQNGEKGTIVVGETKKGFMGRMGQKTWTEAVMAQLECNLRKGGA